MARRESFGTSASIPPGFVRMPPRSNFFRTLGRTYVKEGGDGAPPVFGLHVRPKHANRHGTGHGGFLATLADTFMAAFIQRQLPEIGGMWTTGLTMEYRRPAAVGAWLQGHLVGMERTGDTVTIRCELRIGALVVCRATGIFKIVGKTRPR
ncbi:MAG TPA: PaaI family thioesterase [Ferrovibrio sp.]|jgi:uncharacterized protein (TIGR00369 family)|uniref:PaaI family thioesterase n=1 Tax=Ferrovibrio sp. TaxID=1917215 RepID=UPI002ED3902D